MDEEMNYSLYDINGDAYCIKIQKREAILYDQDALRCYRMLNQLKRKGIRPNVPNTSDISLFAPEHNSTMNFMVKNCPSPDALLTAAEVDDLRSPCKKKGRTGAKDLNSSFEQLRCDEGEEILAECIPTNYITSWDEDGVHLFINEMGARIEKFKPRKVPKTVYDDIAQSMLGHGYKFDRDALYSKKRGLDTYYCTQKKKGNTNWPFFQGLKHLHSGVWPQGFLSCKVPSRESGDHSLNSSSSSQPREGPQEREELPEEEQSFIHLQPTEDEQGAERPQLEEAASDQEVPFKWNDAHDKALVEEVFEAQQKFEGRDLLKNIDLFKEVSKQMLPRGVNQNHDECKKRYEHLKGIFNKYVDEEGGTGEVPCTWHLYQAMFNIEKDSVTTKPPATVSLGAVPKVKRANVTAQQPRVGRERPPNETRQKRAQKLMGNTSAASSSSGSMGYRNRALDIQEKRLELERQYLEQFAQYRLEAKDRGNAIRESVKVLKDLKSQRDTLQTIQEQ